MAIYKELLFCISVTADSSGSLFLSLSLSFWLSSIGESVTAQVCKEVGQSRALKKRMVVFLFLFSCVCALGEEKANFLLGGYDSSNEKIRNFFFRST